MSNLSGRGPANPQGALAGHSAAREDEDSDDETEKRLTVHESTMETLNGRINHLDGHLNSVANSVRNLEQNHARTTAELQAAMQQIQATLERLLKPSSGNNPPETSPFESGQTPKPPILQEVPAILQGQLNTEELVNAALNKELAKKASQIPEVFKLRGTDNYDQWLQALTIMFRAIGLPNFVSEPSIGNNLSDKNQAVLLSLLRDSLTEGPQALIAWESHPTIAFITLKSQYSLAPDIQRGYLYHEFHSLNYCEFQGSLTEFNAKFNGLLSKLALSHVKIEPIDQINRYLQALEKVFPTWAERVRGNIRQFRAIGQTYSGLNLQWLMADITEEQRNPASSAAKSMVYWAKKNEKSTKLPKSSKSPAHSEAKKPPYKKPWKNKEKSQGKKVKSVTNADSEYACVMGLYSLESDKDIEDSTAPSPEVSSSEAYFSDVEAEYNIKPTKTAKKLPKDSNRPSKDALLYDTGATVHIVNSKKWFKDFKPITGLKPVMTGGGPVTPLGIGTAVFKVLSQKDPIKYTISTLKNTLYLPSMDINIYSGVRHYSEGGCLSKETLYGSNRSAIGLLDFKKSQFFLTVQGVVTPTGNYINWINTSYYSASSSDFRPKESLVIELNPLPKEVRDTYIPIENIGAQGTIKEASPPKPWKASDLLQAPEALYSSDEEPEPSEIISESYQKLLNLAHLWHQRLGHIGLKLLKKTYKVVKNLPNLSAVKERDFICTECNQGKMVRRGPKKPIPDPLYVLDVLQGDTFKIKPIPRNNCPIGLIIIDRKSRYRWVFLLKNKEGNTVSSVLKLFFKHLKTQYNRYPKLLHYDEGTEIDTELKGWLGAKGISFNTSSPYIHEQNGLVERSIRVLLDRLRTTIIASGLPVSLWCYILPAVLELVNKTAITNKEYTPFQLLFDELEPEKTHLPDLSHYKVIGSACEVLIPHENRPKSQKLLPRTESARLLAVLGTKIYLVYIPSRRVVQKTSFIKIIEDVTAKGGVISEGESSDKTAITATKSLPLTKFTPLSVPITPKTSDSGVTPISTKEIEDTVTFKPPEPPKDTTESGPIGSSDRMDLEFVRYLTNTVKWDLFYGDPQKVPKTYKQALKSPEKDQWLEAILQELAQIIQQGVFEFIPMNKLPKNKKLITSRWVFTEKPTKLKARLVIRGFQQVEGLDYTETFASTSSPPTWRVLLAYAASEDLEIEQIDFIGAFLNGDLEEDIFITVPEGVEAYNVDELALYGYNPSVKQIIHLKKALYGLKQAPKQWQVKVQHLLKREGYKPLVSDTAVYFNAKKRIFIVSHVDDCLIIGPSLGEINTLKGRLHRVYAIEDLGPARLFLGVKIDRDRPKRLLWLSQSHYILEALKQFNLQSLKSASIPLQPNVLVTAPKEKPVSSQDFKLYQRIIGTVMYLMVQTRPDISFPVQWLSRALQGPSLGHFNAAKALLRYINSTKNLAICFGREAFILKGFSDSDFAGCKTSAKSTYGYLFTVAGGPISWKSKRGSTISLSTLEAEFSALTEATREIQWLTNLFAESKLPFNLPITLYGDNEGANTAAYNCSFHSRTKHTLLKFQYVKEKVLEGLISIVYLDTLNMPADGLTKPLLPQKQKAFLTLLGLEHLNR